MGLAVFALVFVAAAAGHASAQPTSNCGSGRGVLDSVEHAGTIARVEVVAITPSMVTVNIVDQMRGTTPVQLRGGSFACRQRFVVGDTAIVLTTDSGYLDSLSESVIVPTDPRIDAVLAIAGATSDRERADIVAWTIANGTDVEIDEAALYLASSTTTLVAIGRAHRLDMRREMRRRPTRELALALARLRVPLSPSLYVKVGLARSLAEQIAPIRDFEPITDPAKLADIITGELDQARRFAAFERCDRLRPRRNALVTPSQLASTYAAGATTLAWQCRAAPPPIRATAIRPPLPPPPPPPRPPVTTPKGPVTPNGSPFDTDLRDPFAKPRTTAKPTPKPPGPKQNPYKSDPAGDLKNPFGDPAPPAKQPAKKPNPPTKPNPYKLIDI